MIDLTNLPRTVEQRVVELVRQRVQDAFELSEANAQRYNGHNGPVADNGTPPDAYAVIAPHDSDFDEESPADTEDFELPLSIDLHITNKPDGIDLTDLAEPLIGLLHQLVHQDRQWTDPSTNDQLAVDTVVQGRYRPDPHAHQTDPTCGIDIVITTRNALGDPFTPA